MSAAEYQHVVLPAFKADGKVLFGRRSWILQQDGARIHTAASSMVEARALAPGGLLEPWPANSPDFSPIENVRAMMAEIARSNAAVHHLRGVVGRIAGSQGRRNSPVQQSCIVCLRACPPGGWQIALRGTVPRSGSEYFCPTCKQYNWPSHYLNTPTHTQSTISTSLNATKAVFLHAATVDT